MRFVCPQCSQLIESHMARRIECPECGQIMLPSKLRPNRGVLCMMLGMASCFFALISLPVCLAPIGLHLAMPLALAIIPGLPVGVFAWAISRVDRKGMEKGVVETEGAGLVTAGWICGIVATICQIVVALVSCGMMSRAFFLPFMRGGK